MSISCPPQNDLLEQLEKVAPFLDADYRGETADLKLYRSLAEQHPGPVLELGCGTGRVMAELIKAGRICDGLDLSPTMLDLARQRCTAIPCEFPWQLHQCNMTAFDLNQKSYGLAILASNTFMHVSRSSDQEKVLACVHQHLLPGGKLVLDLFNPPVEDLVLHQGAVQAVDSWPGPISGSTVTKWVRREVDWVRQIQKTFITYETLHVDSRLEQVEARFNLRFLWRHEAEMMLEKTGFNVEAVWGSYLQTPMKEESELMVIVGRK